MEKRKYNTEQRKELLLFLISNKNKFLSAEDIEKYAENEKINIGLTTIYRFLNSLEKQGKVRIELKEHTKYYQYIFEECEHHYHLKCKRCGKIIHLDCEEFEELKEHVLKEHGFVIDSKFEIYGLCEKCYKKMEEDKNE
ncbi:MAG: transcriptional repressor [Clostridia bacterium]|nr:transcriptional repressor [Clostridia bacterium]